MDCFRDLKWNKDTFGYDRLVLTPELALKSIEFSDLNYHCDIKHWVGRQWHDITLIRDGVIANDSKQWSRQLRPLEHLLRTIREIYTTNSSKVIVLGSKIADNKYVIGISFSGTVYSQEWLNNFKVNIKNGFHAGFIDLAEKFDSLADNIDFPEISKDLRGFKTLTLKDILTECTGTDSRFYIWVTGHSQGGGVAISYIVNCLSKRLVLDKYILCITIASPTVALSNLGLNTIKFPIYNIINQDDIVTRLGSQIRFGIDICYKPDEEFRLKFYSHYSNPVMHQDMQASMKLLSEIKDTPMAIELAHSVQKLLSEYKPKDTKEKDKRVKHKLLKRLQAYLVFSWFSNQVMADTAYKEMTGHDIDISRINYWYDRLIKLYEDNKLAGLTEFTTQAHMLNFEQFHTTGPEHCYRGIILYEWENTKKYYWKSSDEGYKYVEIDSLWLKTDIHEKDIEKKSKIARFFSKLFGFNKNK